MIESASTILGRSDFSLGLAFLAGMISLPHCAVMCGPILAVFAECKAFYQGGRVIGYTIVGAILGTLGAGVDEIGTFLSIQNLSLYAVIAAAFFVLVGVLRLGELFPAASKITAVIRRVFPGALGALAAGITSALLPCGVLFPLWAYAAVTGSAGRGAVAAFSFAVGTVPGLFFAQWLVRAFQAQAVFQKPILRWIGVVLLALGTVWVFADRSVLAAKRAQGETPQCHDPGPQRQ